MTKKIAAVILLLGFCAAVASAADAPAVPASTATSALPASVGTWLTHLKEALTQSTLSGEYQKGDVAQVAAVRGAQQDATAADPNTPVWKGGFADEDAAELKKERAALAQGVNLMLQGQVQEGRVQILAFEKQYPKSSLLGDAQEALKKTEPAASATPTPVPTASAPAAPSSR